MKFQDLLYMHGFDNIEWQIPKNVYIELQKHFHKDIFEEIIKYCYKKIDKLGDVKDIFDNIALIIGDEIHVMFPKNYGYDSGRKGIQGPFFGYRISTKYNCYSCYGVIFPHSYGIIFPHINRYTYFDGNGVTRGKYNEIVICKYHEVNEIRNRSNIKKLIKNKLAEEKEEILKILSNYKKFESIFKYFQVNIINDIPRPTLYK